MSLYMGLVWLHLNYGHVALSSVFKKDAVLVENMQYKATKLVLELAHLECAKHLKKLRLLSLLKAEG